MQLTFTTLDFDFFGTPLMLYGIFKDGRFTLIRAEVLYSRVCIIKILRECCFARATPEGGKLYISGVQYVEEEAAVLLGAAS